MSGTRKLTLDPTKLSRDEAQLLSRLLLEEEKKTKAQKGVTYEPNVAHPFTLNNESYEITFTNKLARRKKLYKQIIVLNEEENFPDKKTGSTLYLKKDSDGNYFMSTRSQPNPIILTFEQAADLQKLDLNSSDPEIIQQILSICHLDEIFHYQTFELKPFAKGGFAGGDSGGVYNVGKLEHSPEGMQYIDYKTPRPVDNTPRKPKVAKVQTIPQTIEEKEYQHRIEQMELENKLWQRDKASNTKPAIRIENPEGRVTEDIMIQNKFEREELQSLLEREKTVIELPPLKRQHVSMQLVADLKRVHEEIGIRHRDIKARNIMIDTSVYPVKVKIADYGAALEKESKVESTTGTPGYISPEIYAGKPPSQQGDVYAMGLVLRELWQDEVWMKRQKILTQRPHTGSPHESVKIFMRCEYLLKLPMQKAKIPEKMFDGLTAEEKQQITNMLNGFTTPREDERLSLDQAISGETPENKPAEGFDFHENSSNARLVSRQMRYCDIQIKLLFLCDIMNTLEPYFKDTDKFVKFDALQKNLDFLLQHIKYDHNNPKLDLAVFGLISDIVTYAAHPSQRVREMHGTFDQPEFGDQQSVIAAEADLMKKQIEADKTKQTGLLKEKVAAKVPVPDTDIPPPPATDDLDLLFGDTPPPPTSEEVEAQAKSGLSKTKIALIVGLSIVIGAGVIAASIFSFGAIATALGLAVAGLGAVEMGLVIGGGGILGGLIGGRVASKKNSKEVPQNEFEIEEPQHTPSKKSTASIATRLAKAIGWPSTKIAGAEHASPSPEQPQPKFKAAEIQNKVEPSRPAPVRTLRNRQH